MGCCPTCGHKVREPASVTRTCWSCGKEFVQSGPGRGRVVCSDPKCSAKRKSWTRHQVLLETGVHDGGTQYAANGSKG